MFGLWCVATYVEYPTPPHGLATHATASHVCAEGVCVCVWTGVLCVLSTCVCVPLCARDLVETLGFLSAAADPGAPATFTSCPVLLLGLFFSGTELEIMGSSAHKRVHA